MSEAIAVQTTGRNRPCPCGSGRNVDEIGGFQRAEEVAFKLATGWTGPSRRRDAPRGGGEQRLHGGPLDYHILVN